jgi:hypothetical protein
MPRQVQHRWRDCSATPQQLTEPMLTVIDLSTRTAKTKSLKSPLNRGKRGDSESDALDRVSGQMK